MLQERDDGSLDQRGAWRCGEKWSDIRCLLGWIPQDCMWRRREEKMQEGALLQLSIAGKETIPKLSGLKQRYIISENSVVWLGSAGQFCGFSWDCSCDCIQLGQMGLDYRITRDLSSPDLSSFRCLADRLQGGSWLPRG